MTNTLRPTYRVELLCKNCDDYLHCDILDNIDNRTLACSEFKNKVIPKQTCSNCYRWCCDGDLQNMNKGRCRLSYGVYWPAYGTDRACSAYEYEEKFDR